jgi:hypothetical protein
MLPSLQIRQNTVFNFGEKVLQSPLNLKHDSDFQFLLEHGFDKDFVRSNLLHTTKHTTRHIDDY